MSPAHDSSAVIPLPGALARWEDTSALPAVAGGPRLIVPSVRLSCPAGHELELPAEYAARREVFCPQCRRAFRPDAAAVKRAERRVRVGLPGKLRLGFWRRREAVSAPPAASVAVTPAAAVPAAPEGKAQAAPPAGSAAGAPLLAVSPRAFQRLISASGWMVSAAIHAALLVVVACLGVSIRRPPEQPEVVLTATLCPPEEPRLPEERPRRDLFTSRHEKDLPDQSPALPETAEAAPEPADPVREPEPVARAKAPVAEDLEFPAGIVSGPKTPRPAVAAPEPLGVGASEAAKTGPGAGLGADALKLRTSAETRLEAARKGGGGADTESAVEKALQWLAERQLANGAWRVSGEKGARRTVVHRTEAGAVAVEVEIPPNYQDLAATGLAALAFLGAGYDARAGKHKEVVARAVNYLVAEQKPTGCWAALPETQEMHTQGIATLALVEAYLAAAKGEEADRLKAAATRAVQFIVDGQYPYSGWGYGPYAVRPAPGEPPRPADRRRWGGYVEQSVVIWNGMALKAARTAGLAVDGRAFSGLVKWLDDGQGPDGNYAYSGTFDGSRVAVRDKHSSPCMAAAALMMRLWTGSRPEEPASGRTATVVLDMLERNRAVVAAAERPGALQKSGPDLYFLHHGSIALFQMGGDRWARWNRLMKPLVLDSQAADGSWAPSTYTAGPVLTTALGALVLESYYRYSPLYR